MIDTSQKRNRQVLNCRVLVLLKGAVKTKPCPSTAGNRKHVKPLRIPVLAPLPLIISFVVFLPFQHKLHTMVSAFQDSPCNCKHLLVFPTGFSNPIPFFYPVYLTILLVHREFRDEANSRRKYGASWDEYCRRVPYRILPKIFQTVSFFFIYILILS